MKNDWYCPQNWSTSSVPDEFSNVIIPDVSTSSFAEPAIMEGRVLINSILIQHNGSLTIAHDAVLHIIDNAVGIKLENLNIDGSLVFESDLQRTLKNIVAEVTE